MIENKIRVNDLERRLDELKCCEDKLDCLVHTKLSLEKEIKCETTSIVHLKQEIKDLQQKIGSSKINC